MAVVLRVTDKRGRGIYVGGGAERAGVSCGQSSQRPMPYEDGIPDTPESHRFGFKTPRHLRAWFWGDIGRLREVAQVRMYEVPDEHVRYGRSQLTFSRQHAKLVGIKQLDEV